MGVTRISYQTYSPLTVKHLTNEYQVKDEIFLHYYQMVKSLLEGFIEVKLEHIPRRDIVWANVMSKLTSTKKKGTNQSIL